VKIGARMSCEVDTRCMFLWHGKECRSLVEVGFFTRAADPPRGNVQNSAINIPKRAGVLLWIASERRF
jgi:hypothetical protein